jgi:hypothetical protein
MNMHKNARLTPRGRERIVRQVESGQTPEAVAEAAGVPARRGPLARAHAALKSHPDYDEHAFCVAVETAFADWTVAR